MMKLVLLSGGSGKRLWPLSKDSRSKQFLKLLKGESDELVSMIQRVWSQLERVGLADSAVIATNKAQVDIIQSQLSHEIPVIIEPVRMDTFPAITLASTYLYSVEGLNPNDIMVVLPVDPYVDDQFFHRLKDLAQVVRMTNANIGLMGITPTYPSEKYGYIVPSGEINEEGGYQTVSHFVEKPKEEVAKTLLEQGAFWNSGVFAFKLDYILNLLLSKGLPIHYEEVLKHYGGLPKISFDYEVVEKAENIVVIPYEGKWKDLGTWNTLTEEMGTHLIGKGIISPDSVNTHLINELDIPVTVLGISDAVVAVSADGILVSSKEASPRIKDLMKGFEQRPMFEERRWGWYRVLDYGKMDDGNEVLTKRIGVKAGMNLSYQLHLKRSEVWTIIKGEGLFVLDDEIRKVKSGDVLQIPIGAKHGLKAITDLEFIEVQQGSELIEEDILRIYMTWEEVEQNCNLNI